MSKIEHGYLIQRALREALKNQAELLKDKRAAEYLPVILKLTQFIAELEQWYSGKYHLHRRSRSFLAKAKRLVTQADKISEKIWYRVPINFVPFLQQIYNHEKAPSKDKQYPNKIRSQFNNFRLGLLEQFAGARLLENNSDLGEELERLLVQYLERRLGNSVRIVRGGNICDYDGNRDNQTDIIITSANALGFCPADTGNGKHDVMIDQVIAAISVTSKLTAKTLRQKWNQLQKIPQFKEKDALVGAHTWPLCYIISAESDDLQSLETEWEKLTASGGVSHNPQMLIPLDSGYIVARNASWPTSRLCQGPNSGLNKGDSIYAGLGLAWLETQIAGRNCLLTRGRHDWIERLSEHLGKLEWRDLPPLPSNFEPFRHHGGAIHGQMFWGMDSKTVHNKLELITICLEKKLAGTILTKTPITKDIYLNRFQFEPRWFKFGIFELKDQYCALEEWLDPHSKDPTKRQERIIVVFDTRTGEEITSRLTRSLNECSDLAQLNPITNSES